ncbi:ATP12 [Candida theae]|uniref:ATP12 n=1 Tax=Candida theae TaxID=1198502 RepID=A0AAD5BJC9_9ASCO|nr:ATP12 [Candida theae]KAI5967088.1 ATP12 [Candida theae]
MLAFRRSPIPKLAYLGVRRFSKTVFSCNRLANISSSGGDKTVEHNIKSETNRLSKTGSRFWDKGRVFHNHSTGRYEIQLDGKTLRTPLGLPLTLPESKKQLAYLIAHEWTHLPKISLKSSALPLTGLAARAIDLESAGNQKQSDNDGGEEMLAIEDLKLSMLKYLDTDTCLIFAGAKDCDGKLRKKQEELYRPLIDEYNDFFTQYGLSRNLLKENERIELKFLDCEKDGLRGNRQTLKTQQVVVDWLDQLDIFEFVALEKAILTTKSFLCAVSVLRSNVSDESRMSDVFQLNRNSKDFFWYKTVEEIIELGNLETILQTGEWGEVEDTHDVEQRDWLRSLTSAALLSH